MRPSQVAVTSQAAELLRQLGGEHGPLMFHQSGGCCDGSAPMCYPAGELHVSQETDRLLGELVVEGMDPIPVWMAKDQYAYWSHTHLTIDVVPGRGSGFSLESPTGLRFLTRSRLLTDEEAEALTP
ncbi:DUF779 domain-containing protein [Kitasatospora sp. GP82]|uniref:DUF779 domain-containing protein n=1 Tax=Kitasatospora sp. GP82 TaxID=3035089 RepID=UPI0024732A95|nr:DUF779 domain-containing protein [Kitasatospora sp. GP82]MDH6124669.1 uncharacterized protein (DUF779 family) [Kitasatospora sp. GP82]